MFDEEPKLQRELKTHQYFTLAFGAIVGVGWIIVMSVWLGAAGPLGASAAFGVSGVLMTSVGLIIGKLAERYPVTGGAVAYAHNIFGPRTSFLIGWFMALTYIGASAFSAISAAWVLETLVPALRGPVLYNVLDYDVTLGSVLAGLSLQTFIVVTNLRGAGSAGWLQDMITFGLLAIGVLIIGAAFLKGDPANLDPLIGRSDGGEDVLAGIMVVLAMTPFFLAGFDVIPQAMGERKAGFNLSAIGPVIVAAILIAMVFYVSVIFATSMLLPRRDVLGMDLPVAGAFAEGFGTPLAGKVVLACGFLGVMSSWNALFYSGCRVLYALGRSGALPEIMGRPSPQGAPRAAIFFVGVLTVITVLAGRGAISPIVNNHGAVMSGVFLTMCTGAWVLLSRDEIAFRSPFAGRFITGIASVFSFGLILIALLQSYLTRTFIVPVEWLVMAVWSAAALLFMGQADADTWTRKSSEISW